MTNRIKKTLLALAALAALALGGSALAGATGGSGEKDDTSDVALTGATLDQAKAAALKATGGGKVNETERDSENGATYEVEVTKTDGSTVDVRLDESFKTVAIEGDSEEESGEDKETSDGPDQGPDQDPNEPGHQD